MGRNLDERIRLYKYLFGVQGQRAGQIINELPENMKPAFRFFHLIEDIDKLREVTSFLKKEKNELSIKLRWVDNTIETIKPTHEKIEIKIGNEVYWYEKELGLNDEQFLEKYCSGQDILDDYLSEQLFVEDYKYWKSEEEDFKNYIDYKDKLLCEKVIRKKCSQNINEQLFEKIILDSNLADHNSIADYIFNLIEKDNFISSLSTIFNSIPQEYCLEYLKKIIYDYILEYEKYGMLRSI